MRLTAALFLIAVPCFCAAAPSLSPEETVSLIAVVRKAAPPPAFARALFEDGVSAWNAGRPLDARNAWLRADAWFVRTLPAGHPSRDALARLAAQADQVSRPEPTPAPSSVAALEAPRPRRRSRRNSQEAVAPVDARAVMDSARAAKKAGELEKAAKLMRIAGGLPGGEGAAAEADALEREALQPAR